MPTYPLALPDSFRFLSGDQDVVEDNIVEARDSRGQIQARDLGGARWTGSFNLTPMSPNEDMYKDWRAFISQLRQSFGTFLMTPLDVLTGQKYKLPECSCYFFGAELGDREIGTYDFNRNDLEADIFFAPVIKWLVLQGNLYEVISVRPHDEDSTAAYLTINPPLATPIREGTFITIREENTYCIARATTITQPTLATNGMYSGAGIAWTQAFVK